MAADAAPTVTESLAQSLAADDSDDATWRVYADALAEQDALPAFFARALQGLAPDPESLGYLKRHIASAELEVRLNRFHFIEAAAIHPRSTAGHELILRDLISEPAGRFVRHVRLDLFPPRGWDQGLERELLLVRHAVTYNDRPILALRSLTLGVAPLGTPITFADTIVKTLQTRAPHLVTTADTLVHQVNRVRVKLARCPPGVQVGTLAPGTILEPGLTHFIGATPTEALTETDRVHLFSGAPALSEALLVRPVTDLPDCVEVVLPETGRVVLDGIVCDPRNSRRVLAPGQRLEFGPGVILEAEGAVA